MTSFTSNETARNKLQVEIEKLSATGLQSERFNIAIQQLKELVADESRDFEVSLTLADIYANQSLYEQARQYYEEASKLALTSSHPQAREALIIAKAELASCLFQEAKAEFEAWQQEQTNGESSTILKNIFCQDLSCFSWSNVYAARLGNPCPSTCPEGWRSGRQCIPCYEP